MWKRNSFNVHWKFSACQKCNVIERRNRREYNNTTALIKPVQIQGAHSKTARPLRLIGHLKRLHHISPVSRK